MPKKNPHPRSVYGFAERHGICPATVYNEIKRGKLKSSKIGSRRIITESQEAEYLARSVDQTTPERPDTAA